MATTIGVAHITLTFEDTFSLKDKRRHVRSLIQRVRNQFNVSIAEVADLDDVRTATIAFVCVSNSSAHADEMMANVLRFIENRVEVGVLADVSTELIHYGA